MHLCKQTSPKHWFGNMTITSNYDVTNSAHQIQLTTICHRMKTLILENFLRTLLPVTSQYLILCWETTLFIQFFLLTVLKCVYMNRQLSSKVYNRVKNLYCLFSRCFFVMTKFGIFVSCLAYSETLFGIFCLRGLGNTVVSLPKHVLRLHQVFCCHSSCT